MLQILPKTDFVYCRFIIYILERKLMSNMVFGILKKPLIKYKTIILKHLTGGAGMNEIAMLHGAEPREILQTVIKKKVPAIMSYLSKGKWHVAKALLTNLGANRLDIQLSPSKRDSILRKPHQMEAQKSRPINIQVNQPVGISLKYEYGKFIFETTVVALEPSSDPTSGGTIVLRVPDRIEIIQRRSYFRVDVPSSLKVNVMLWHRHYTDEKNGNNSPAENQTDACRMPPEYYWQGRLADISAGGAQIVVDNKQKPDFKKGQFIGLRFTPMPYEMPLMFNAQIRNILPTADQKCICLGLQIVGLEASPEGRQVLQRLCGVVEHYYQINQSSAKQRDFQTIS
jgi:c-di-GMP-binding flagellar brake protein YcgR